MLMQRARGVRHFGSHRFYCRMQNQRGYPRAWEHRGTAALRPQMNPDLYSAVIFSTHFESTERRRHSETEGTEAELQLSAGQGRRVSGGQRSCRWAHASAGSPPKGQCGEGGAWHQRSPIMPFHSQDT